MSKFCGLGQAGFPLEGTEMSPNQPFPFKPSAAVLPSTEPDYHLVHTAIPNMPHTNSLEVFPNRLTVFLASFAKGVSNSNNARASAKNIKHPIRYPPVSRKAGYSVHSILTIPPNRFNPLS